MKSEQAAPQAGEPRRDDEGRQLVAQDRVAREARALLVLADRHETVPSGERWKRHTSQRDKRDRRHDE